jgi:hypothetical protein
VVAILDNSRIFFECRQLGPISEFMINSYCDSLKDTFAQLVYYGILKEEDAQCFSVQSSIEGGSFLLAAGALLLALLNTFVIKAVVQYFRDKDEVEKRTVEDEEKSRMSLDTSNTEVEDEADDDFSGRIHPVPVLFTDTFRWVLRQENRLQSSSRALFVNSNNQWGLPEATVLPCGDSIDGKTIEGQYVAEGDVADSKRDSPTASRTTHSDFSGKGRRLSYGEDEKGSARRSFTDDSLAERRSFKSDKDSAKRSMMEEQDSVGTSFKDEHSVSAASVARSTAASMARSTATSVNTPSEFSEEEMTVDDGQTEYEVVEEGEYNETASRNDAQSEYVEETVDDYEEYTVKTMSDIEEEYFEDYSEFDSQSEPRQLT